MTQGPSGRLSLVAGTLAVALAIVAALVAPSGAHADPPAFVQPQDITVVATSAAGAVVEYTIPFATDDNGEPFVYCDPSPGQLFPVGNTTVTCTAEDQETGEQSEVSFVVHVLPRPQEQITVGNVTASLFYKKASGVPTTFKNFRIQISRSGVVLLDQLVPPYPSHPNYGVAPAGYGQRRSVFIRDLDKDGEPEVLLDLYWGGAHCCFWTRVYRFDPARDTYRAAIHFWGDPSYRLRDLNANGRPEFVSADDRFAYRFTSFAFSGFPIQVWSYAHGKFSNVTRRFPKQIAQDAARQWRGYLTYGRRYHDCRGILAAWAADEYLLGHGKKVDRGLNAALKRGDLAGFPGSPRAYIRALKRFLRSTGYIHR